MHLEGGGINQETRPDESIVQLMVAQNMTSILAKKSFDALPEFLHPIDVLLLHAPGAVGRIRRSRPELFDLLLDLKIPRNIGNQILHQRERFHWLNRDRLLDWQIA